MSFSNLLIQAFSVQIERENSTLNELVERFIKSHVMSLTEGNIRWSQGAVLEQGKHTGILPQL